MSVFDDSTGATGDWPDGEARPLAATSKLEQVLQTALASPVVVERLTLCLVDHVRRAPAGTDRGGPLAQAGHDALMEAIRPLESLWMVRGAGVL